MDIKDLVSVFSKVGTLKVFSQDEIIYRQTEVVSALYFIRKGKVRNFVLTADGKEMTSTISIDGEFVGPAYFFDNEITDTTAQAMEKTDIFVIGKEGVDYLINHERDIVYLIMKSMAQKIRILSLHVTSLAFLSADKKIIKMLIHLAGRYSKQQNTPSKLTLNCTHEDIALFSNTSRSTVTQVLNALEKKHLVSTGYRSIIINDIEALKDLSE